MSSCFPGAMLTVPIYTDHSNNQLIMNKRFKEYNRKPHHNHLEEKHAV
uniref:Uncharacterized protein n=1 Tax=Rhizophora mucronata TaxID=61149 RepID=A0A2P2NZS3_RHIMU